jgi:hypothetical protein
LQVSGIRFAFDPFKPPGSHIVHIARNKQVSLVHIKMSACNLLAGQRHPLCI